MVEPPFDFAALRQLLDRREPAALAAFFDEHPERAGQVIRGWPDHPLGTSPLAYLAMARYDTMTNRWRDVAGTGAAASVLIAAGAPVDGDPADRETPLITAASYGDADIAAVLITAGADVEAVASEDAGGVPGGSALLHAAVFGMTAVLDLLVAAGASIGSFEEACAAGDLAGRDPAEADRQTRIRGLAMAVDHQRVDVITLLLASGTPIDEADEAFGRHPLRLAAANGRVRSVDVLLAHGADRDRRDSSGRTALDLCRLSRQTAIDAGPYDAIERLLDPSPG